MKNSKKSLSLLGISILFSPLYSQTEKPNVIYIFPDQFRNHALEFWNEEGFKEHINFTADPVFTPNLNKFARESVVLTSAQSNCPVSSPHRGMLLTGMYPDGSGVSLNCNSDRPISSLRSDAITISDVFSQNGYDCAYIGKYHLDFPIPNNPQCKGTYVEDQNPVWDAYTPIELRHGFNYWYSYGTYNVHKAPHYWDSEGNRHEIKEWSPKHEADKAIEYMTHIRDSSKPFFLMVSMNPPHSPYESLEDCMEEDYNLYKDIPLYQLLVRPNINPELKDKQKKAPYYFASVTGVDREFGRIIAYLKESGLDDNTIIVFSSDHGETMASHLEDPKNSPYTESMNVPFLIRYPEKLSPHVNNVLLSTPDIMPTLLSLAGLKEDIPVEVQGKDLSRTLILNNSYPDSFEGVLYIRNVNGDKDENNKIISYFPVARGIKTHEYTLAITIDREKQLKEVLLFHDGSDPYQRNNLCIKENAGIFQELTSAMGKLLKKADDPWYRMKILEAYINY